MRVLITGAAGFIGAALTERLLQRGDEVLGFDNLNTYYDVRLKHARLERLQAQQNYQNVVADLKDRVSLEKAFADFKPQRVVNLAAQAGVRYSIDNPQAYVDSNLVGFVNMLEACRHNQVEHLVYASSSSVYGSNKQLPFSVRHGVDHPVSLYAATKKANELMAHTYSHLYKIPTTGLRFFTVYGPWGRPDMALFKFTANILADKPIEVFNNGNHTRDFTYIDDIIEGVVRVLDRVPTADPGFDPLQPNPASSTAPFRIYNIGNHQPVALKHYIDVLERCLNKSAQKKFLPQQPGDVPDTYADIDELVRDTGYSPSTSVEVGVRRFVDWYRAFYCV